MLHHDIKYLMTLKNKKTGKFIRVYCYGKECLERQKEKLIESAYSLDSSLLSYLQDESILIINMRKICVDKLMENIEHEIKKGLIRKDFVFYNAKGVSKLLKYCSKNHFTKTEKSNRYVIHYLTHQLQSKKRR